MSSFNVPSGWGISSDFRPPPAAAAAATPVAAPSSSSGSIFATGPVPPPSPAAQHAAPPPVTAVSQRPTMQSEIVLSSTAVLKSLTAADFLTPSNYPTPLHVRPPTIPEHQIRPKRRWSDGKFCNPDVPSYVPPELLLFGDGKPLQVFLARARIEDMKRLCERGLEGLYYMRAGGELPPGFRGVPADELRFARESRMRDLQELGRKMAAASVTASVAPESKVFTHGLHGRDGLRIVRKIFFTPKQVETERFGCLFGSRGATQKALQTETRCKIILGGRGITDIRKVRNVEDFDALKRLAEEDPHVAIYAPTEAALRLAVERIEFLLSDDPESERARDFNRRRGELDNGYQFRGTVAPGQPLIATTRLSITEAPAAAAANTLAANDEDVDAFLRTL
jgi:hypothetical protein